MDRALHSLESGNSVYVVLPNCSEKIKKNIELSGINVISFKLNRTGTNPISEFFSVLELNKVINKIKPDLIHSVTIKPNLYCSLLSSINNIALISTFPGLGTLRVSTKKRHWMLSKIIFNSIKLFTNKTKYLALFENQEDMDFFTSHNYSRSSNSIRVFGAGVDTDKFMYKESRNNEDNFHVLFASRLLKNKGLELLVRACEELNSSGIKVTLSVAGIMDKDSPFSFSCEELDELLNSDIVNWLGQRDDIAKLIEDSDIVALPTSYGEGIPRILIESCAIGRPIVTTDLGGCKDICVDGFNGFIVAVGDNGSLLSALKKLALEPKLKEKMGTNGRQLVTKRFSNEHIFSQQDILYKKMLASKE